MKARGGQETGEGRGGQERAGRPVFSFTVMQSLFLTPTPFPSPQAPLTVTPLPLTPSLFIINSETASVRHSWWPSAQSPDVENAEPLAFLSCPDTPESQTSREATFTKRNRSSTAFQAGRYTEQARGWQRRLAPEQGCHSVPEAGVSVILPQTAIFRT